MGVTNHFIDVDKLKETIERVDDICQNNKQYENKWHSLQVDGLIFYIKIKNEFWEPKK